MDETASSVILDACVLVPASLRDILLRAGRHELYQPVLSDDVLIELERVLMRREMVSPSQAARLIETLRDRFAGALIQRSAYVDIIPTMTNDPKDRHVLAAALIAVATTLVTFNLPDFPDTALAPYRVAVQTPDTFLAGLWRDHASTLIDLVRRQSAALRRPVRSIDQVLDNLALHAPEFAALAREALRAAD